MSHPSDKPIRSLFCLVSGRVGGGNKILSGIMQRLREQGQHVDIFFWHKSADNVGLSDDRHVLKTDDLAHALQGNYDFVFLSNAILVPLALPHLGSVPAALICQGYESFCYGTTYNEAVSDYDCMQDLLKLPVDLIATSGSIQSILANATGRDSHFVPVAIDKSLFYPRPAADRTSSVRRVLMVGDYLQPFKGMTQGFEALEQLAAEMDVELVLITQVKSGQKMLNKYNIAREIHYRPQASMIPEIYASCHAYCCTSWYEGFGLPSLEAFSVGVPVVSTRNLGVHDFGIDGHNLLLAEPDNSCNLYEKLKLVLSDDALAARLATNGRQTAGQYDWDKTMEQFTAYQANTGGSEAAARCGAGATEMNVLLDRLHNAGLYTPESVFLAMRQLYLHLEIACQQFLEGRVGKDVFLSKLGQLQYAFTPYLSNPQTEYFASFKARYDAIKLMIALCDAPQLINYVRKMCQKTDAIATGASRGDARNLASVTIE